MLLLSYIPRPLFQRQMTSHSVHNSQSAAPSFMHSHPQAPCCMPWQHQLHEPPQVTYGVSQVHTDLDQGHWKDSSEEEKFQWHIQTVSGV